jgi:hypothetical protein
MLIVSAEVVLCVANLRAERKAASLLRDLRKVQIGESTEIDVQHILGSYGLQQWGVTSGFCKSADAGYAAVVRNDALDRLGLRSSALRPFGNRAWSAEAVVLTDHDRVCAVLYFLRALRSDGVREVSVHVYDQQNLSNPFYRQPPYDVSARVYKDSLDFTTRLTIDSTNDQRQHALDFDLSCLSRVGGCRQPCELMPSVWLDYQRRARAEGLALPPDEFSDPRCKRVPDLN